MALLLYLIFAAAATVLFTVSLCRRHEAHQRRASYGTLLLGAFVGSLLAFLCAAVVGGFATFGWVIFTPSFWVEYAHTSHKEPPGFEFILLAATCVFCVLPSIAVIVFFQRRAARPHTPAA